MASSVSTGVPFTIEAAGQKFAQDLLQFSGDKLAPFLWKALGRAEFPEGPNFTNPQKVELATLINSVETPTWVTKFNSRKFCAAVFDTVANEPTFAADPKIEKIFTFLMQGTGSSRWMKRLIQGVRMEWHCDSHCTNEETCVLPLPRWTPEDGIIAILQDWILHRGLRCVEYDFARVVGHLMHCWGDRAVVFMLLMVKMPHLDHSGSIHPGMWRPEACDYDHMIRHRMHIEQGPAKEHESDCSDGESESDTEEAPVSRKKHKSDSDE